MNQAHIEQTGVTSFSSQLKRGLHSEYILWAMFAALVSARFLLLYARDPANLIELIGIYYFDLLLGILVFLFPFVFYQVFGIPPLQAMKKMLTGDAKQNIVISGAGNVVHMGEKPGSSPSRNADGSIDVTTSISLLQQLTRNAEILANRIYTRSGVYLISGVLIAFAGILYFSLQNIAIAELDSAHALMVLAPRFGILFFIEFIAFFFLRQYRAAMDEFRYYDAIKRNRESQLAIFLMATNDFSETDFHKVVENIKFFEQIGKLSKGETTELLELSKINKNELETLKEAVADLAKTKKTQRA